MFLLPCLTMFAPIAEIRGVKRQSETEGVDQTETSNIDEIKPNGRLQNLMCRLLLQHEAAHQADARDDNFTFKVGKKLGMALGEGLQNYIVTCKAAREGENFQGHPVGEKTVALLRSVTFSLAEACVGNANEVEDAAKNGQAHEQVPNALQVQKQWGGHRPGHGCDRTRDEMLQGQVDRRSRGPISLDMGSQSSPKT
ncbi:unnamed protein product [Prorocentrum cordatum]|uniref:Uncharacterized protein n=1 Tax=Prorocentrum cordatum TaxID=2364126 RepID=A0ABN9Q5I8_9DINO|nr:unnamed protein product [Polarella glacialis]